MKEKIRTYFALLVVTIFVAGAVLLIVHAIYSSSLPAIVTGGSEANYAPLQESILHPQQ